MRDSKQIDFNPIAESKRPYTMRGDVLIQRDKVGDWGAFSNLTDPSTKGKRVGCRFERLLPITAKDAKKILRRQGIKLRI